MRANYLLTAILMLAVLAFAACGGDEESERTADVVPTASATATAPAATATAEATTEPTVTLPVETPTPAPTTAEESEEGGAGDEERIVVPLRVTVDGEGVSPKELKVAPSLPFNLIVTNVLPARLSVELHERDSGFIVPGQSTHTQYYGGLPKGTYEFQFAHLDTLILKVGS